ncbi:MAG: hypothetical protein M0Z36_02715 [Thermaerobacter sp.]|nr:hypothetical protein [Thermaerobacter sp.]
MGLAIIEGGHIDIDRHKLLGLDPDHGTVDVAAQQLISAGLDGGIPLGLVLRGRRLVQA